MLPRFELDRELWEYPEVAAPAVYQNRSEWQGRFWEMHKPSFTSNE
jgi:hypothetical protein